MTPSIERAKATTSAAGVFLRYAGRIAERCDQCGDDELVVADVRPDLRFGNVRCVSRVALRDEVATLPDGTWTLIFAGRDGIQQIRRRCFDLHSGATERLMLLLRRAGNSATV